MTRTLLLFYMDACPTSCRNGGDPLSSCSCNTPKLTRPGLDGLVPVASIHALLGLLLSAPAENAQVPDTENDSGLGDAVRAILHAFSPHNGEVNWEQFRTVMEQSTPLLLTELTAFFTRQFPGQRSDGLFQIQYRWKLPLAMLGTGASTRRSFLSIPHFRQLGLVLPHALLDKLSLLHQSSPDETSCSDIRGMIATTCLRLLAISGTTESGPWVLIACISPERVQEAEMMETYFYPK
ncbi:hypothetical protein BU23DRAFT_248380 [Bimuria novae-zelandiae CBS 107.79]|uniref:Uncharacterized protein n=1 Tax=Bimuria novae-zelandiae CBS 107.79 TaxID=1447943 RepID=A0A6A5UV30_9PLEO|nr:hypothetical protein BU23DRAFT_248380 [Bimuria novae-zelandiae CBS 107.79]